MRKLQEIFPSKRRQFITLTLLTLMLPVFVFSALQTQGLRQRAAGDRLVVTIPSSESRVDQLGTYHAHARLDGAPYSGNLYVSFQVCDLDTHNNCTEGATNLLFVNGVMTGDLAPSAIAGNPLAPKSYYHAFWQVPNTGISSNPTEVHVTPIDMTQYWLTDDASYLYNGLNKKLNITGKAQIDYITEPFPVGGRKLIDMRFSKSNDYMYIAPCWHLNDCPQKENGFSTKQHLHFFLSWSQNPTTGEEALTAPYFISTKVGPEQNDIANATSPVETTNKMFRYDSDVVMYYMEDSTDSNNYFPYYQTPRFIDLTKLPSLREKLNNYWVFQDENREKFMDYKTGSLWNALYYNLPKPVMLDVPAIASHPIPGIRVGLAEKGQASQDGGLLREDWYFVKGVGLVRLDQKNFFFNDGNNTGNGTCHLKGVLPTDDADCGKTIMENPDFTMTLATQRVLRPQKFSYTVTDISSNQKRFALSVPKRYFTEQPNNFQFIINDSSPRFDSGNYGVRIMKNTSGLFYYTNNAWQQIALNQTVTDASQNYTAVVTAATLDASDFVTLNVTVTVNPTSKLINKPLSVYLYAEKDAGKNNLLLNAANKRTCPVGINCYGHWFDEIGKVTFVATTITPTPTNLLTPTSATLPAPSNLVGTCTANGRSATVSWGAGLNAGYALRVDNTIDGWGNNCATTASGDFCSYPTGTSHTFVTTPGATYRWWVHAVDSRNVYSPASQSATFTCPVPTPTQRPLPTPTQHPLLTPRGIRVTPDTTLGNNRYKITWSSVEGATYYAVSFSPLTQQNQLSFPTTTMLPVTLQPEIGYKGTVEARIGNPSTPALATARSSTRTFIGPSPLNLKATCSLVNGQMQGRVEWGVVAGHNYALRVNNTTDPADGWNPDADTKCASPDGDFCQDFPSTMNPRVKTFNAMPGNTYRVWVHAKNTYTIDGVATDVYSKPASVVFVTCPR